MISITQIPAGHKPYGYPDAKARPDIGRMITEIKNERSAGASRSCAHPIYSEGHFETALRSKMLDVIIDRCGWKPPSKSAIPGLSPSGQFSEMLARDERKLGATLVNFLTVAGAVHEGMQQAAKAHPNMGAEIQGRLQSLEKAVLKTVTLAMKGKGRTVNVLFDGSDASDRASKAHNAARMALMECRKTVGSDIFLRGIADGPVARATLDAMRERCPTMLSKWEKNPGCADFDDVLDRTLTDRLNTLVEENGFSTDFYQVESLIHQMLKMPEYVVMEKPADAGPARSGQQARSGHPLAGAGIMYNGGNRIGDVNVDLGDVLSPFGKFAEVFAEIFNRQPPGSHVGDDVARKLGEISESLARLQSALDSGGVAARQHAPSFRASEPAVSARQFQVPPHGVHGATTFEDRRQQSAPATGPAETDVTHVMLVTAPPVHEVMTDLIRERTLYPKGFDAPLKRVDSVGSVGSVDSGVNSTASSTEGSGTSSEANSRRHSFAESFTLESLVSDDGEPVRTWRQGKGAGRPVQDARGEWQRYVDEFQKGNRQRYGADAAGGVRAKDVVAFVQGNSEVPPQIPEDVGSSEDVHRYRTHPMVGADVMGPNPARFNSLLTYFGGNAPSTDLRQRSDVEAVRKAAPDVMESPRATIPAVPTSTVVSRPRATTARRIGVDAALRTFLDGMVERDAGQDAMPVLSTLPAKEPVAAGSVDHGSISMQAARARFEDGSDRLARSAFQVRRTNQHTWLNAMPRLSSKDADPAEVGGSVQQEETEPLQDELASRRTDRIMSERVLSGRAPRNAHWKRTSTSVAASGPIP